MNVSRHLFPGLAMLLLSGCGVTQSLENAARNIQLNTPEPIKVDMKITLDVYQHEAGGKEKDVEKTSTDAAELNRRKYNRQKEIQELKNSRLVAETHRGLLFLREQPAHRQHVLELAGQGHRVAGRKRQHADRQRLGAACRR